MKRRRFLAVTAGSGAAGAFAIEAAGQAQSPHDQWLAGMTARHRCVFDFPDHLDGLGLIRMLNYFEIYRKSYGEPANTINAIGTFYGGPGPSASMPMAWNDAVWEKYGIGEVLKLTDPGTRAPARRNMFHRPKLGDPVLRNGAMTGAGIDSLRRMGAIFLMCNNAFMTWIAFLSGNGTKGNPADIERDIRANLLPGVVTVPAMVIALEKAQGKGIAYERQ